MFLEPELFSALSASLTFSTLRRNSMKAYWNPPQVPRNGQFRRRANSMPLSMPSKLLYGLPGAAHRPSKLSSVFSEALLVSEDVGIHSDSTVKFNLRAACCREFVVAWCEGNSVLKSPMIPMRTALLTRALY